MIRNQKLVDALEAMPEKKLGICRLYNAQTGLCCALGSTLTIDERIEYSQSDNNSRFYNMAAERVGLSSPERDAVREFNDIQAANDCFEGTPEARWQYMHDWSMGYF